MLNITTGKKQQAVKAVLYGVHGIGKTTFASKWPDPLFLDVENGSGDYDIRRIDDIRSWTELVEIVKEVRDTKPCATLVVDTVDWAEKLCIEELKAKNGWKSMEALGYGKCWNILKEEMARFLDLLGDVADKGMNVLLLAHADIRTFDQPDERGSYDRYEMKLSKKVSPIVKEWAGCVLFANYKTIIEVGDNGKAKARGKERVMFTQYDATHDAKNRWGLPEEVPLDYASIAEHIPDTEQKPHGAAARPQQHETAEQPQKPAEAVRRSESAAELPPAWWAPALRLMERYSITPEEVRAVSASRGHFTLDTPIANMPKEYIDGCVVPNWAVFEAEILKKRDENDPVPF